MPSILRSTSKSRARFWCFVSQSRNTGPLGLLCGGRLPVQQTSSMARLTAVCWNRVCLNRFERGISRTYQCEWRFLSADVSPRKRVRRCSIPVLTTAAYASTSRTRQATRAPHASTGQAEERDGISAISLGRSEASAPWAPARRAAARRSGGAPKRIASPPTAVP